MKGMLIQSDNLVVILKYIMTFISLLSFISVYTIKIMKSRRCLYVYCIIVSVFSITLMVISVAHIKYYMNNKLEYSDLQKSVAILEHSEKINFKVIRSDKENLLNGEKVEIIEGYKVNRKGVKSSSIYKLYNKTDLKVKKGSTIHITLYKVYGAMNSDNMTSSNIITGNKIKNRLVSTYSNLYKLNEKQLEIEKHKYVQKLINEYDMIRLYGTCNSLVILFIGLIFIGIELIVMTCNLEQNKFVFNHGLY